MRTLQQLKQKNPSSVFGREVLEFEDLRKSTTYKYDVVGTEVGDSKETSFYPQVKMMKWDNECNFSLRFNYPIDGSVEQVSNTIYWKSADKKVEAVFYDIAPCRSIYYIFGGFEFEVIFNEIPISNKVEFSIQSKNLNFYKQQKLDDPMTNCDDMIIDSYAIYHSSKKHNKYTTGKAFHLYRSFVSDSNGRREYCDMNIDADILTITIPQDFIDNAVYPITLDPTIGNTNIGAYLQLFTHDSAIACSSGIPSGINPKAVSISAFACWETTWTTYAGHPGPDQDDDENYSPRGLKMCLWEKATGKFIVQSFDSHDGVVDEDGAPFNFFPFYIYNLPPQNGALGYDNDPTTSSEEYPANYKDFGFDQPQRWLTHLLTPLNITKRGKFHDPWGEATATRYVSDGVDFLTGEKHIFPSENYRDDEYRQQYMSSTPTPIDNIEYYIGVVFNYDLDVTGYSGGLDNPYCVWGSSYCANLFIRRNTGIHRQLCRFDIVPSGGYGCETGEDPWWPTFADQGWTFRMFAFPYDLQRVPIGGGQWEDRNYSVYLNYISSSSQSSSTSTSSTSSTSSSSAENAKTFGNNTGDDYTNVVVDTYLREDFTTRNYGESAQLELNGIDGGADKNVLIKFDLSSLPGGANIEVAKLYVKTVKLGQGVDVRDFVNVYKMLVPWQEGDMDNAPPSGSGSTWSHKVYSTSELWNVAGANGSGTDHEVLAADRVYFVFGNPNTQSKWYSFDVAIEVSEQIAGNNYGFILTGEDGIGGNIPIYSSNGVDGNRPYLYLEYN